jgi:GTP-binding protein
LIANKCDHQKDNYLINEFYKLGVKEIMSISALSGKGTGDLLDAISQRIKKSRPQKQLQTESQTINVAIVGRPNVGKSSLLNKLIGQKRTVVSEKAGTTRDTARFLTTIKNKKINFIDTAGIRRRGKVGQTDKGVRPGQIEKYSVLRAMRAIEASEVVLLLVDVTEGITSQDLHIAGFALEKKKSIIIVVNKWDLAEKKQVSGYLSYLDSNINFLPFAPVIFLSAKTGQNVSGLFDLVFQAYQARFKRIKTAELNAKLSEDILKKPPIAQKNILPNIKYITQAEVNPPTFVFFTNHPQSIHFSYIRFLENRIREHWDFSGTPISILFKKKSD